MYTMELSALEQPAPAPSQKKASYSLRLSAETSIATQAALIGGFSLAMIPNASADVVQVPISQVQQLRFVALCLCGVLNLYTLLMLGHINWLGLHLLSAGKSSAGDEVRLFREFWKQPITRFGLTSAR